MKKRSLSVLALFMALVTFALTGCNDVIFGNGGNKVDGPRVDLTYYGYKADAINLRAMENAIHAFEEKHAGVKITYEGKKGDDYYDILYRRMNSNSLDDMFMIDHDSSVELIKEGLLEDLSDIIDPSAFIPSIANQFVNDDNTIYFVPTAMISFGLYCNMSLLAQHGFDHAPTNIDEFTEMCNHFVANGIVPIVANKRTTVRTLVVAKGLYDIYRGDDTAEMIKKINSGEVDIVDLLTPGVEMVCKMFEDGWMDGTEAKNTAATSDDLAKFREGNRPFMITGTWASPRLSGEDGGVGFEYAIYPYPIMQDGGVLVLDIATCISVNAKGENKETAKEFVKHMVEPEVIWEYCDSQSSFTPIIDDSRLPADETMQPQIEYLFNGRNVFASNFNMQFQLNDPLQDMGILIMEGKTSAQALEFLRNRLAQNEG